MKLGIIAAPRTESFYKAASKGLEFVEFCIDVGRDVKDFEKLVPELRSASDNTGVSAGSIGRWGTIRIDEHGIVEEELDNSYRLIDAASNLGCEHFVCGCNYIESLTYYENCSAAIEYFSKLIDYGKSRGFGISVYNCDWNNFVTNDTAWRVIVGHLQELGIKYDPSHSRYGNRDYLKEMNDWGDRFRHVHIKGSVVIDGRRIDDPPAGMDQTDWGTFMAILIDKNYRGGLSIEPHSRKWAEKFGEQGVDFTIDYMKRHMFSELNN